VRVDETEAAAALCKSNVFISGPCPILVLTMVLSRPLRADAKNGVKNYQGLTTSRENAIQKYLHFPHTFF
jgi:hypothetical protein